MTPPVALCMRSLLALSLVSGAAYAQPAPTVIAGYPMPARPPVPVDTPLNAWWEAPELHATLGPHGSVALTVPGEAPQVGMEEGSRIFRVPFVLGTFSPDGLRMGGCVLAQDDRPGARVIVEADGAMVSLEALDCWDGSTFLGAPAPGPAPAQLALNYKDHLDWRDAEGGLHRWAGQVRSMSWSNAGDLAFAAADGSVWVAPGGGEASLVRSAGLWVLSLAWSADGSRLAVLRPGALELRLAGEWTLIDVPATAMDAAFDGEDLVVAWASALDRYDTRGRLLAREWDQKRHPGLTRAESMRVEGAGPVLRPYSSAGWRALRRDWSAWQWDDSYIALFEGARYLGVIGEAGREPRDVAFDPSGERVAILAADGSVGIYETRTQRAVCRVDGRAPSWVPASLSSEARLKWAPSGERLWLFADPGYAVSWRGSGGCEELDRLTGLKMEVADLPYPHGSPNPVQDGPPGWVSVGYNPPVMVELETGATFAARCGWPEAITDDEVTCTETGAVVVTDRETGALRERVELPDLIMPRLSADGRRAAGYKDGRVRIVDVETGEVLLELEYADYRGLPFVVGDLVVFPGHHGLKVFRLKDGGLVLDWQGEAPQRADQLRPELRGWRYRRQADQLLPELWTRRPQAPRPALVDLALDEGGRILSARGGESPTAWDLDAHAMVPSDPAVGRLVGVTEELAVGWGQGGVRYRRGSSPVQLEAPGLYDFTGAWRFDDRILAISAPVLGGPALAVWDAKTGACQLELWLYSDGSYTAWWADGTVKCGGEVGCVGRWEMPDGSVRPLLVPGDVR